MPPHQNRFPRVLHCVRNRTESSAGGAFFSHPQFNRHPADGQGTHVRESSGGGQPALWHITCRIGVAGDTTAAWGAKPRGHVPRSKRKQRSLTGATKPKPSGSRLETWLRGKPSVARDGGTPAYSRSANGARMRKRKRWKLKGREGSEIPQAGRQRIHNGAVSEIGFHGEWCNGSTCSSEKRMMPVRVRLPRLKKARHPLIGFGVPPP